MKLAYPVSTPEIDRPLLTLSGDPERVFAQLKSIGYAAIEPFISDPNRFDASGFLDAARNAGLAVAAVGTGPIAVIDGLVFSAEDDAVRNKAIERTKSVVDFASQAGSQVNVGKLRGPIHGSSEAATRRDEAFRQVCRHAKSKDVPITLEPQSRSVIDNLNSSREGIEWVQEMAEPNLHLMLDTFHMASEDPDPLAGFAGAADHLLHIHFADTERLPPGAGTIDFPSVLGALRELSYDRFVTLEIAQNPDELSAAKTAFASTTKLLQAGASES